MYSELVIYLALCTSFEVCILNLLENRIRILSVSKKEDCSSLRGFVVPWVIICKQYFERNFFSGFVKHRKLWFSVFDVLWSFHFLSSGPSTIQVSLLYGFGCYACFCARISSAVSRVNSAIANNISTRDLPLFQS